MPNICPKYGALKWQVPGQKVAGKGASIGTICRWGGGGGGGTICCWDKMSSNHIFSVPKESQNWISNTAPKYLKATALKLGNETISPEQMPCLTSHERPFVVSHALSNYLWRRANRQTCVCIFDQFYKAPLSLFQIGGVSAIIWHENHFLSIWRGSASIFCWWINMRTDLQ